MKCLSVFVILWSLAASASAQAVVLMTYQSHEEHTYKVFEREERENPYHAVRCRVITKKKISSPHAWSVSKTKETLEESNQVVGISIGGFSHAELSQKRDGSIYLALDEVIDHDVGGFLFRANYRSKIQMWVTSGSWKDYLQGKTIELRATPAGENSYIESCRSALEDSLNYCQNDSFSHSSDPLEWIGPKAGKPRISKIGFNEEDHQLLKGIHVVANQMRLEMTVSPVKTQMESKTFVSIFDSSSDSESGSESELKGPSNQDGQSEKTSGYTLPRTSIDSTDAPEIKS